MIGMGAFGKIFRGHLAGKLFVVKELADRSASEQVLRLSEKEAELLKLVAGHDNIASIHGYAEHAMLLGFEQFNFAIIDVEHDPVFSLKQLMQACDCISDFIGFEHLQQFICTDIITGLAFLHSKGVAHRDFKPDNVLVYNRHYEACSPADLLTCHRGGQQSQLWQN